MLASADAARKKAEAEAGTAREALRRATLKERLVRATQAAQLIWKKTRAGRDCAERIGASTGGQARELSARDGRN